MKNIIICCDGTGNEFGPDNSNVVKLYGCLELNDRQVAYYHPGVGTMGSPNHMSWVGKHGIRLAGLVFGFGFRSNVGDAYRFLMDEYEDGDHVFLFGFSRGAYTVRALAGAVYMYGLLCSGNEGHLPYLLRMYARASRKAFRQLNGGFRVLAETAESKAFRETFSRTIPIHFIGVWDTVSSIGWIYDPVKLLFDGQNPIMRKGRHAVSVDERRCFYQANLWGSPLPSTPILAKYYNDSKDQEQDIVQAWFAGAHSDVGGSYIQDQCSPALDALKWILDEAESDGLNLNQEKKSIFLGEPRPGASKSHPVSLLTMSGRNVAIACTIRLRLPGGYWNSFPANISTDKVIGAGKLFLGPTVGRFQTYLSSIPPSGIAFALTRITILTIFAENTLWVSIATWSQEFIHQPFRFLRNKSSGSIAVRRHDQKSHYGRPTRVRGRARKRIVRLPVSGYKRLSLVER
jgi:uncharacterized protein (DUF2235 family)